MWPFRADSMATEVKRRGITLVLHSTQLYKNLPAILESGVIDTAAGLIARLGKARATRYLHDPNRYERFAIGLDYVNCSITVPNVELLYRRSKADWQADWVHLAIDPAVLSDASTRFCAVSAAHERGRHVGAGLAAFRALFADEVDGSARADLPKSVPTHPQAEVLLQHAQPLARVLAVHVVSAATALEVERLSELHRRELTVQVSPHLFVWPERMVHR